MRAAGTAWKYISNKSTLLDHEGLRFTGYEEISGSEPAEAFAGSASSFCKFARSCSGGPPPAPLEGASQPKETQTMTHPMQTTALDQITELLAEHEFDGIARGITVLLNEVMEIERAQAPGAAPYQRTQERAGHVNGYKPKTLYTRLGPLTVEVPQTRGVEFYPSALEKGVRSERALDLAVAEKLRGLEVTRGQVSRAAVALVVELKKWRDRPSRPGSARREAGRQRPPWGAEGGVGRPAHRRPPPAEPVPPDRGRHGLRAQAWPAEGRGRQHQGGVRRPGSHRGRGLQKRACTIGSSPNMPFY
jgi:hypothetical protein